MYEHFPESPSESIFCNEQATGNPRHCLNRCGGGLRRNRECAETENGKPPETGSSVVKASVAASPESVPALGCSKKRKGEQS